MEYAPLGGAVVLSGEFNFAGSLRLSVDIYETPFLWRFF